MVGTQVALPAQKTAKLVMPLAEIQIDYARQHFALCQTAGREWCRRIKLSALPCAMIGALERDIRKRDVVGPFLHRHSRSGRYAARSILYHDLRIFGNPNPASSNGNNNKQQTTWLDWIPNPIIMAFYLTRWRSPPTSLNSFVSWYPK